jgi:phosphoglycerol transferase MdoB-like AlkP superfamily enzyme
MQKKIMARKSIKRLTLSLFSSLALIFLFSVALTAGMFFMQTNGFYDLKIVVTETKGAVIALNFLPIFLATLSLFFIFNNIIPPCFIVGYIVLFLSILNRFLLYLRQTPLLPWDFYEYREGMSMASSYVFGGSPLLIVGFVAFHVVSVFLLFFLTFWARTKRIGAIARIAFFAASLLTLFIVNNKVYKNPKIYNSLYVLGNVYNQAESFNSKGFIYSFLYEINNNNVKKLPSYNKKTIESYISEPSPELIKELKNKAKPSVFMILGEAFSDIGDVSSISYEGFIDPLENFKRIKSESISGNLIVPGIGGGTADTEFDVLTGANTRFFRGAPYSYKLVAAQTGSLASLLLSIGYKNIALSPSYPWFYDRQNVFKRFGFTDYISKDYFGGDENYKGMYVKETVTMDGVIERYNLSKKEDPDAPFFEFVVTIQNHGPYWHKYLSETNFQTTADLSADQIDALSNYFEGLADADRELNRLCEFCKGLEEPIVIVYFGDHVPGMDAAVYEEFLDSDASDLTRITNRYRVPFIIWQNDAAKAITNDVSFPDRISSCYLYSIFLKFMGFEKLDSYAEYLLEVMREYPILMEQNAFDSNGELVSYDVKIKEKLINWQYYKIFESGWKK